MSNDIADQADGYIAVFWNGNGNVAVCQVVFDSVRQAQDWAEAALTRDHGTRATIRRDKTGVRAEFPSGDELGWTILPTIRAEADRDGGTISSHLVESIR